MEIRNRIHAKIGHFEQLLITVKIIKLNASGRLSSHVKTIVQGTLHETKWWVGRKRDRKTKSKNEEA